ncbi:SDR family oxidoreductase [Candidatus Bathyarchaeota archaeon]|nr:SDR family oxidoreductase [Candidatus Bathyarchaeota archaeon]
MSLSGKIALVTGAGSGIGKISAIQMAQNGAELVLLGRNEKKLAETSSEISTSVGKCKWYSVDVTNTKELSNSIQKIRKECGEIDILVNSAGVNIPQKAEDVTIDAWNTIMDTNVKGLFFCCQAVGRQSMIPRKQGVIVNISSQAGKVALPLRAAYCSSKGAVDQLTRVLAFEWAKYGVRVNAVAPTFVETPFTKEMLIDQEFKNYVMNKIPLKRLATPLEVANAVCFLATNQSSMITGAIIPVDGGWTIH